MTINRFHRREVRILVLSREKILWQSFAKIRMKMFLLNRECSKGDIQGRTCSEEIPEKPRQRKWFL